MVLWVCEMWNCRGRCGTEHMEPWLSGCEPWDFSQGCWGAAAVALGCVQGELEGKTRSWEARGEVGARV